MKILECVYQGKSSFLQEGSRYEVVGWNKGCYWVRREGHPTGKMYSRKHFIEVRPKFSEKLAHAVRSILT